MTQKQKRCVRVSYAHRRSLGIYLELCEVCLASSHQTRYGALAIDCHRRHKMSLPRVGGSPIRLTLFASWGKAPSDIKKMLKPIFFAGNCAFIFLWWLKTSPIDKGYLKVQNLSQSNNKFGYIYVRTPQAIAEKAQIISQFFRRKIDEYEALNVEIESIYVEATYSAGRA